MKTQIRLLEEEHSDQGLHCMTFCQPVSEVFFLLKSLFCLKFKVDTAIFWRSENLGLFKIVYYIFIAVFILFLEIFKDNKSGNFLRGDKSFRTLKCTKSCQN